MDKNHIRNFSIIAHIDHGKSTLADRILDITGAVSDREKREQFLDQMDIERERGITIKAQTVTLPYTSLAGEKYVLNLIDTPGHVDFHYEVSRSLQACEGALLIVDATQGVQAQTIANALIAMAGNLEIIPVINKIDLPSADVERVKEEIEETLGIDASLAIPVSAKTGAGVKDLLEGIVNFLPPPKGSEEEPLRALIFDSWFDVYQGVVVLARVVEGKIAKGMKVHFMHLGKSFEVLKLGQFTPLPKEINELTAGEVGFVVANIKDVVDAQIGDTITSLDRPAANPLKGFQEVKSMVFAGLYPVDSAQYEDLREALEKLKLNDAAFTFEPETSLALGFGFRCGFLGSLHIEIVQERLEREYNINLISTAPTVVYKVETHSGKELEVHSPAKLPDPSEISQILEPYVLVTVHTPSEYLGGILGLCQTKRGEQQHMEYFGRDRVMVQYLLPFSELMVDFYDQLKSASRGYASLDYELREYRAAPLVKLSVLINGDNVDALSIIVHRDEAQRRGRDLVARMKDIIPRQMYDVAIQAAVGAKIIARETVKAMRKDVTAKCYGGDITRKRKLLEKQKAGKKRMKQVGSVEIPQEAFRSVLSTKK
ncbi:MAG: elongation factor 4 [Deltaproteobacteria bacterium CG_4_10_14_0_2_um_filter_43_8]|nr:MAG: elongation factor 4 [Deltaproteobacteria bacterium CG11_big_fil_rev_8_21_14_0_20_42_23]PJA22314.1 MAG: elongation factor 4 [Deltaproteobacteria bacterium CG_4_10_14_0_2_um_filter_43_8]PJC64372.1 MAG: elongation factor 4 [Deltaproteobacteria bacterium CG_4_9_14_0_2_um_filter_42_21]